MNGQPLPTGGVFENSVMQIHAGTMEVRYSRICLWVKPMFRMRFSLVHPGTSRSARAVEVDTTGVEIANQSVRVPESTLCAKDKIKPLQRPRRCHPQKNHAQLVADVLVPAVVLQWYLTVQVAVELCQEQSAIFPFVNTNIDNALMVPVCDRLWGSTNGPAPQSDDNILVCDPATNSASGSKTAERSPGEIAAPDCLGGSCPKPDDCGVTEKTCGNIMHAMVSVSSSSARDAIQPAPSTLACYATGHTTTRLESC